MSELKRVVFLYEAGKELAEDGGVLCLQLRGDSDRLKTGIYGRGFVVFRCLFYSWVLRLARSDCDDKRGCHSRILVSLTTRIA